MHTAVQNKEAVYCVGKMTEYTSFLHCCRNMSTSSKKNYVYYGERLSVTGCPGKNILLLNSDISNIALCIKYQVRMLAFYHQNCVITESDTNILDSLEEEYLSKKLYLQLKQLNLIRLIFDVRQKSVVLSARPIHIQMEHTTFCNARCIMCDHYIAHNRGSKHLALSAVKRLETLLPYASMIIMHGNGEPLINPDILPIFDLYRHYHIKTSLNTNLSFLSDDILAALKENCSSIHVSCDGISREQYESIRQGLSFDKFVMNVKRLADNTNGIDKVLEVVLMRQNICNAKEFVRFAFEHGFSKVIFNSLGCNEWIGNEKDGLDEIRSLAIHYCMSAKEEGERLGISVTTPFDGNHLITVAADHAGDCLNAEYPPYERSELLHKKYTWYSNTIAFEKVSVHSISDTVSNTCIRGICEYPFGKTYIDLNGNVSFCCPASRKIVDTISNDKLFEDIWNGPEYQQIRKTFYTGHMPLLCQDCYFVNNNTLQFAEVE